MPVYYHFNSYLSHLFTITIAPLIHELQWSSLLSLRYFAVLSALKTSLCQEKQLKKKFFSSKKILSKPSPSKTHRLNHIAETQCVKYPVLAQIRFPNPHFGQIPSFMKKFFVFSMLYLWENSSKNFSKDFHKIITLP